VGQAQPCRGVVAAPLWRALSKRSPGSGGRALDGEFVAAICVETKRLYDAEPGVDLNARLVAKRIR